MWQLRLTPETLPLPATKDLAQWVRSWIKPLLPLLQRSDLPAKRLVRVERRQRATHPLRFE
jgi:hypothetical protein